MALPQQPFQVRAVLEELQGLGILQSLGSLGTMATLALLRLSLPRQVQGEILYTGSEPLLFIPMGTAPQEPPQVVSVVVAAVA